MIEAPSNEGAFLVSETPPSGSLGGGVLRGYRYQQPEQRAALVNRRTCLADKLGGGLVRLDRCAPRHHGRCPRKRGELRVGNFPQYDYALVGLMVCQVVAFS